MLVLTILQGPDKGRIFELPDDEPQLLGRSSEALPLSDSTVSRRHAELTPDGGQWFVRDLGSQNGTWVNGVRIDERTRLKPGDQVRCGATLVSFGRGVGHPATGHVRITRESGLDRVERTLASNDDSVILSEPEPRHAAADHLRIIYKLTTLTSQIPDRQQLLEGVMDLVFGEFKPERGCIMMIDRPETAPPNGADALEFDEKAADRAKAEDMVAKPRPAVVRYAISPEKLDGGGDAGQPELEISRSILQHALIKGEGVLLGAGHTGRSRGSSPSQGSHGGQGGSSHASVSGKSVAGMPGFAAGDSVMQLSIRSAICSPIRFRDRTYGAIYIDSSIANYSFTSEQLALLNAVGQHTGLALANAELYQQKLHAERLAAMGETVASLSHSIKNILQGLRGGADVVEIGLKKGDLSVSRGGWGILKRNLDRIIGLTMNMLAYSRPRTLELELVKIGPLLEDCESLLRDRAIAKGITLLIDADAEMPPVPMDAGQMHQALVNLMTNAVEAVEPTIGNVTVRAEFLAMDQVRARARAAGITLPVYTHTPLGEVHIQVIDNGPGIAPEMASKVFEPFFTTKGLRGTGLGLAVTKRIAELHGGSVTMKSATGRGTIFTLAIPVDPERGMDPSQTTASRPMAQGWAARMSLDTGIDPRQL